MRGGLIYVRRCYIYITIADVMSCTSAGVKKKPWGNGKQIQRKKERERERKRERSTEEILEFIGLTVDR